MVKHYARKFYKSKEWQNIRRSILQRDNYLCVNCGEPAAEIHHIEPVTADNINNVQTHTADNLVSLCRDCHCRIHNPDRRKIVDIGQVFDEFGYLIHPPG